MSELKLIPSSILSSNLRFTKRTENLLFYVALNDMILNAADYPETWAFKVVEKNESDKVEIKYSSYPFPLHILGRDPAWKEGLFYCAFEPQFWKLHQLPSTLALKYVSSHALAQADADDGSLTREKGDRSTFRFYRGILNVNAEKAIEAYSSSVARSADFLSDQSLCKDIATDIIALMVSGKAKRVDAGGEGDCGPRSVIAALGVAINPCTIGWLRKAVFELWQKLEAQLGKPNDMDAWWTDIELALAAVLTGQGLFTVNATTFEWQCLVAPTSAAATMVIVGGQRCFAHYQPVITEREPAERAPTTPVKMQVDGDDDDEM